MRESGSSHFPMRKLSGCQWKCSIIDICTTTNKQINKQTNKPCWCGYNYNKRGAVERCLCIPVEFERIGRQRERNREIGSAGIEVFGGLV